MVIGKIGIGGRTEVHFQEMDKIMDRMWRAAGGWPAAESWNIPVDVVPEEGQRNSG